jgi:glycosyltransferase involved in cell wall biosynthesis
LPILRAGRGVHVETAHQQRSTKDMMDDGLQMMESTKGRQPIHALYCILDNRCGGPHRLAHAVACRLRQDQVETVFLLGYKAGATWRPDGFPSFLCRHIQCFRRQAPVSNFLRFCAALPRNLLSMCRIIRSNGIDVVHVDGVTNFVPALAGRLAGKPIVWLYNDYLPRPLRRVLLPLVTALASTVVVQGECLRQSLTAGRSRLRDKTVVLYSAVDPGKFTADENTWALRRRLRQELGIPAQCTVIGTVRNVNRLKGYTHFLEAAAQIKEKLGPVKFLVVGRKLDTDPGYWDHLQQLTTRLGLEQDVIYTGFRDDIPAILAALDLFVLASLQESCPVALLEAMAMKVPVVATDVGAVREMVTHDETGLVVPPGDSNALAQAVLAYLAKPQPQVRTMVEAARKKVEQDFTVQTIARQQKQLYERLCRPLDTIFPHPDPEETR